MKYLINRNPFMGFKFDKYYATSSKFLKEIPIPCKIETSKILQASPKS